MSIPTCVADRCRSGREPCTREACRNAPPHWLFRAAEVVRAAIQDFPKCYAGKRGSGHGRLHAAWLAFDAAVWPIEAVPATLPGLPIVLIEPSIFDRVMTALCALVLAVSVAGVAALVWFCWVNRETLAALIF